MDGARLTTFNVSGDAHEDEGTWSNVPIAVLPVGARRFWVTWHGYYESAEFEIHEVSTSGVRRLTTASFGGC
jgi:hypothetical protein